MPWLREIEDRLTRPREGENCEQKTATNPTLSRPTPRQHSISYRHFLHRKQENPFSDHARRCGKLAETDPQWQAQPVWLQGQIKDFMKASRQGGAPAFLEQLREDPLRLQQLQVATEQGTVLQGGKGRGR